MTGNGRVIYSGEPVIQVDQIGNGEIVRDTELSEFLPWIKIFL
ncbi:MAG: hypothetical protein U0T81_02890 [Saprospiraceae bacterium]